MSDKRPSDSLQPLSKRKATGQVTKDMPEDNEDEEPEVVQGEFAKADEEVLKARKIVKVRRSTAADQPVTAPTGNPFAGTSLTSASANPFSGVKLQTSNPFSGVSLFNVSTTSPQAPGSKEGDTADVCGKADTNGATTNEAKDEGLQEKAEEPPAPAKPADEATPAVPVSSSPSLFSSFATSNTSPFAGLGSGTSSFGFGSLTGGNGTAGGVACFSFGGGSSSALVPPPAVSGSGSGSFTFPPPPGSNTVFGAPPAPAMPIFGNDRMSGIARPTPPKTGEEDERVVYNVIDALLYEFDPPSRGWRERGRGELSINMHRVTGKARLVMRQRGTLKLLLNAALYPAMTVTPMLEGKGVTFAVANVLPRDVAPGEADAPGAGAGAGTAAAPSETAPAEQAKPATGSGEGVDGKNEGEGTGAGGEAQEGGEGKGKEEDGGSADDKQSGEEKEAEEGDAAPAPAAAKLSTFAVKIKNADALHEFQVAIAAHKDPAPVPAALSEAAPTGDAWV